MVAEWLVTFPVLATTLRESDTDPGEGENGPALVPPAATVPESENVLVPEADEVKASVAASTVP
jgi:hypothetical protein